MLACDVIRLGSGQVRRSVRWVEGKGTLTLGRGPEIPPIPAQSSASQPCWGGLLFFGAKVELNDNWLLARDLGAQTALAVTKPNEHGAESLSLTGGWAFGTRIRVASTRLLDICVCPPCRTGHLGITLSHSDNHRSALFSRLPRVQPCFRRGEELELGPNQNAPVAPKFGSKTREQGRIVSSGSRLPSFQRSGVASGGRRQG